MPCVAMTCAKVLVALLAEGVDRNDAAGSVKAYKTASPSSRRAWIEIRRSCETNHTNASPSSRRAWIEIGSGTARIPFCRGSPSSRRAWIEIGGTVLGQRPHDVALLAEGVDRNSHFVWSKPLWYVALLAEGVDRNPRAKVSIITRMRSPSSRRAWIEMHTTSIRALRFTSPSSRRAWIEIPAAKSMTTAGAVALLAEGVDRNLVVSCARADC